MVFATLRSRSLLAAAVFALAVPGAARAALVPLDLDKLTERSERIVCGEVTRLHSYYSDIPQLGRVIVTDVTVKITETWKGRASRTVTLQVFGGTVGEDRELCAESPTYELGERVLVFIKRWQGATWNTGWLQGKYTLRESKSGAVEVVGKARMPIASVKPLASVRTEVKTKVARKSGSGK